MNIYDNVKEIADRKGLTICELESRAGISNGSIGKWKVSSPTVENLSKVSKVLRVDIRRLIK